MTETKYNKLVEKIVWFVLPLIVGLLTFLVVNTYYVKEEVAKVAVKNESVVSLQNKMWEMVQDNNKILSTKADEQENKKDHTFLIEQVNQVSKKVDKIYNQRNYGQSMKKDSIFFSRGVWESITQNKLPKN